MNHLSKVAAAVAATLALAGCAGTHSPETQAAMDRTEKQFEGGYDEQIKKYKPTRQQIGEIHRGQAYHDINNYSLIETDNRRLPEAFKQPAFIRDEDGGQRQFTVDEFAAMIYQAYGVMVDVSSPDLLVLDNTPETDGFGLLPTSPVAPQIAVTGDSTGEFNAVNELLGSEKTFSDRDNLTLKKFSYEGDLKGLLDYVAQLNGVKWKYDPDFQKAYMYAFDTETFRIFDFGDTTNMKSEITTNTSQDSENTSGGSNQQFSRESQINTWDEISESIKSLLSDEHGKITVNTKAGMVTVTDSDYNLAKVKHYVNDLNKTTSTEVVIEFRIIRFNYNDGNDNSINQNYLNDKLQNNLFGSFDLNFGTGNLSPNISGNLGAFQELMQGNFLSIATESHEFLMGFLNTIGTAEVAYETQVNVLNNDFFTDQEQQTEEYISSIERQNFREGGGQENITTERDIAVDGVSLTLKPRVSGDNIMVTYSIGNSDFIGLKDAGLGAGMEGIKLKTQGALNLGQTVTLLNGVPKVIKFTQRSEETTNSQGMFDDMLWFLGGNESRSESRGAVIVTMTAYYNN